jgi:hypothetical protein
MLILDTLQNSLLVLISTITFALNVFKQRQQVTSNQHEHAVNHVPISTQHTKNKVIIMQYVHHLSLCPTCVYRTITPPTKEKQMHKFIIYHNTDKNFQNACKIV